MRIAARYQEDGTLVATRIWASSQFNNVWVSPEGHVLHVNTDDDMVTVENESGIGVPLAGRCQHAVLLPPAARIAAADSTPIGTGPAFLTNENLVRGFKVHASVVDPLATPLVAQNIDIETARIRRHDLGARHHGFTYTRNFVDTTRTTTCTP